MTLIDLESDKVVDQNREINFTEGFLDLDFTNKSDSQMAKILKEGNQKDSGLAQDEMMLEIEGFEESTEVVLQEDTIMTVSPPALVTEATPENGLDDLSENLDSTSEVDQIDTSFAESLQATDPPAKGFADFGSLSTPKANCNEVDSVVGQNTANSNDGVFASPKKLDPNPLENFASFPSIENTLKKESDPLSSDHTLETSPSFKILSDLDQGFDNLTSETPLASLPEEPMPRQSMTLNLHDNEEREQIQDKAQSQSLVEHESWFSWRSIFCLK